MIKPLNLLFLMADEHLATAMSFLGHPVVKTPNLDRLAARGVAFENAYTTSPICVPARASLATGLYAHQCRYWDNALAYDGAVAGWGHLLQQHGIRVTSIGKLHYREESDDTGFDHQIVPMHIKDGVGQVWGSIRNPLPSTPQTAGMLGEIGAGLSKYNQYDLTVTQECIDWLSNSENHEKQWLLFTSLVAPHFPLVVPQEYIDLYPLKDLPWPELRPSDGHPRHPWLERMTEFHDPDSEFKNDAERKLAMAAYFGLCTFMDEQIGRILDALEDSGQADNTMIIYTSDHGETLGMRGRWGKSVLYREATQIPLIMAGPGIPSSEANATPVSLIDMAPTICKHFDIKPPAHWPGMPLQSVLNAPANRERIVFSEYHAVGSPTGAFTVASADWKYNYYVNYPPELFDLRQDPSESLNLAELAEYESKRLEMHRQLLKICDPESVDLLAKADQDKLIEKHGGPTAAFKVGPTSATPVSK